MSTDNPSEEELRAAYEAEIKRVRVEQVVLEQVVSVINLGMRRTGLSPGTEDERDLDQVRIAIESVRALMPLVEQIAAPQAPAIRDAVSQLQLAFVRLGGASDPGPGPEPGGPAAGGPATGGPEAGSLGGAGAPPPPEAQPSQAEPEPPRPGEAGPAQRSGRLWIPGQ